MTTSVSERATKRSDSKRSLIGRFVWITLFMAEQNKFAENTEKLLQPRFLKKYARYVRGMLTLG